RRDDADTARILDAIHHRATGLMAAAERMALGTLSGSCHTPIGAQAVVVKDTLSLRVLVASADGTQIFVDEQSGPVQNDEDAALLGQVVGMRLKARVPPGLLE
ncbi:MAG TPA: hydroxymethylbilane synthase, partial [Micavibrio sp.]